MGILTRVLRPVCDCIFYLEDPVGYRLEKIHMDSRGPERKLAQETEDDTYSKTLFEIQRAELEDKIVEEKNAVISESGWIMKALFAFDPLGPFGNRRLSDEKTNRYIKVLREQDNDFQQKIVTPAAERSRIEDRIKKLLEEKADALNKKEKDERVFLEKEIAVIEILNKLRHLKPEDLESDESRIQVVNLVNKTLGEVSKVFYGDLNSLKRNLKQDNALITAVDVDLMQPKNTEYGNDRRFSEDRWSICHIERQRLLAVFNNYGEGREEERDRERDLWFEGARNGHIREAAQSEARRRWQNSLLRGVGTAALVGYVAFRVFHRK